jgi:hypothetical protein
MKKTLLALLLVSGSAMAQHHDYYRHQHHGHWQRGGPGWVWVAPTIIGGVIGYEIARNQPPVVIPQPPVIVQPMQVCSPWTEVQNSDGTITRTRTCSQ